MWYIHPPSTQNLAAPQLWKAVSGICCWLSEHESWHQTMPRHQHQRESPSSIPSFSASCHPDRGCINRPGRAQECGLVPVRTLLMYAECNDGPNTYRLEFLHSDIDTSGNLLLSILRESLSSGFLLYANIGMRAKVSFSKIFMSKLRNWNSSTAARAVTQRSYEIASHLYPGAKYWPKQRKSVVASTKTNGSLIVLSAVAHPGLS